MLDELSKDEQHFKIAPTCKNCGGYPNSEYIREVYMYIDTNANGTFLQKSFMKWRANNIKY